MKILYIEDNPLDIDLTLRKIKKEAPHINMVTANSQSEALKVIKSPDFSDYDLVLADMRLQDGDGIAILSHVRAHSLPVAVVILTGQGDEESAVAALKGGADDYVVKKSGYLNNLPYLLESALLSYRKTKDKGAKGLKAFYLEHDTVDVDLTRRHFERHAPHIQMDFICSVSDFFNIVDQPGFLLEYSAMLLDYRLPRDNALEILKRINQSPNAGIPVILVTGKGDEEIAVKALKLGAFDYVTKNQGYLFKLPSIIENADYSMRLAREHEALNESEKRYRSLFQNNHVVMLLIDPETGKVVDVNSAAVQFYGWPQEEFIEKNMYEISTLTDEELRRKMAKVINEKQHHFIAQHKLCNGSICDVEVYSGPIEVGGRSLMYSMIYDLTERLKTEREKEQLQKKLIQAQKMETFGQLAGGIAHDFNNILASIIGYSELALEEVQNDSTIKDDLQEIYTAGQRAKDLVLQILAFARQSDAEMKPIQVSSIAKEVLKLIKSSTPSNIEIRQSFETDSFIMGNAVHIHQVMMNLCTNAIHAMENEGGLLNIELTELMIDNSPEIFELNLDSDCYIKIEVSDTGLGIPQGIIDNIFEPYFTTKPPGEGTGMGLATVHGIVVGYGGKITVKSALNSGSVFCIYLPTCKEGVALQSYEPQTLPTGTEKILFVDDEVSITKIGGMIFEQLGYTVTTRTSSLEALELFRTGPEKFDLIISDMTMPNMTGDKLAAEVMKIRTDIPVILCTGYSKKMSEDIAIELGIKALVYKPIVKAELAKTVRKVLDEAKGSSHQAAVV